MALSVDRKETGKEYGNCSHNLKGYEVISSRKGAGIAGCSGVVSNEDNVRDEFKVHCDGCDHQIDNIERKVASLGEGSEFVVEGRVLPE